jgi:DNA-binding transcriptional LysR family regulator
MNDLRRIDLNLLVILDALLSEQHVTRAAERLHLSQPAVSHALARLRDLLGDPLLVRAGAGLVPTSRAMELMAPLTEALAQVQSLLAPNAFDPATTRRTFRLAMSDYGAAIVLPGLIRTLRSEAPGIDLQISHASREGMLDGILNGDIDIAVGVFRKCPTNCAAPAVRRALRLPGGSRQFAGRRNPRPAGLPGAPPRFAGNARQWHAGNRARPDRAA